MKIFLITLIVLSNISFGKADSAKEAPYKKYDNFSEEDLRKLRLEEIFPKTVADYFDLKFSCTHWSAEGGYEDRVNGECKLLKKTQQESLKKIKDDNNLLTRFKKIDLDDDCSDRECEFVKDDPGHKSKALNTYYEAEAQEVIRYYRTDMNKQDPQKALKDSQVVLKRPPQHLLGQSEVFSTGKLNDKNVLKILAQI